MANKKVDLVIEAVHYQSNGPIDWVRAYERRGPTYSDCVLVPRAKLVKLLQNGKKTWVGKRIPGLASTFELFKQVTLKQNDNKLVILTEGTSANDDKLEDSPLI